MRSLFCLVGPAELELWRNFLGWAGFHGWYRRLGGRFTPITIPATQPFSARRVRLAGWKPALPSVPSTVEIRGVIACRFFRCSFFLFCLFFSSAFTYLWVFWDLYRI